MSKGGKTVSALLAVVAASGIAAAKPTARTWVEMSTGSTNRVFVDTSSISGTGASRSASVIIVNAADRRRTKFDFNCANREYRIGSGNWQGDDPANVQRICDRNFKGLTSYSRAYVDAVPLLWKPTTPPKTAPGQWILVDWTKDQMVLVDPKSIVQAGQGWRFKTVYQVAGQGGPVEYQLVADCVNKRVTSAASIKADDFFSNMLGEYARLTSLGHGSTVHAVLYLTFCHDRPAQLHDAPGVDPAAALAARARFDAARARYLQQHPGADLTNVVTSAPGANELGGYQLSLMDIEMPSGLRSEVVGAEQNRAIVQQTWKHPFSAIGHLFVKRAKGSGRCTATLVGNNRTLLTARHCADAGASFYFALGNASPKAAIPARVVAFGDFPLIEGRETLNASMWSPNADWDDWMVLDLDRPVEGEPLAIPSEQFIKDTVERFEKPFFHVAGFPSDVKQGDQIEKMTYTRGCGTDISDDDYKSARRSRTGCASYKGSSGSALLVLTPLLRYVPVGVLSAGDTDGDTSYSILVVGGRAFDAIRQKVAAECRTKPVGVRFHPQACTQ